MSWINLPCSFLWIFKVYYVFFKSVLKYIFFFLEILQVMCEVLFPASENVHQNLTPSIQSRILNSRLKAQCASDINTQPLEEGDNAGSSKVRSACVCQFYLD